MNHQPYFPHHGNGGYRVRHYDLDLDYRPSSHRLTGRASVIAVAEQALPSIVLDFGRFRVDRVLVDGKRPAKWSHANGKLRLRPARPLAPGAEFTVEVRYAGPPHPVRSAFGEIGWDQLTDGAIVASQPTGAPSWFPCDDRPGSKATYRIAVTAPSEYTVFANGRLRSVKEHGGDATWVHHQSAPMPSYLATVQIGRYEILELPGPVHQPAGVPAALESVFRHDFGRQPEMLRVFQELFGPYPFEEYAVVVADDDLDVPIEAQGLSVFGRNHLDGRRGHERLVAHELAHQWFGNSLTLADWRDIWLHEGFACYAEWLWFEFADGVPASVPAQRFLRKLAGLPQDLVIGDPGPARMFDDQVYDRGALTLHALRRHLGDPAFFKLLKEWTATHRHGSVRTNDFIALAQRHCPHPLDELFRKWLFEPALPPAG
ncbi:M1 family metallopeptidase [Crossiella sp. CA198]|uniref:M1 family metallopeptidase n=1 Tax=Crossiella sp. CA198 TaxID=3455607 RepID=UPI003F8D1630